MVEDVDGLQDLPARVLDQLAQDDDPPFLRRNTDDDTTGNYTFIGSENGGGSIRFTGEGSRTALSLNNNAIGGVDHLEFADVGPNEGIRWNGSDAQIYVAPANNANNQEGALRLTADSVHGIRLDAPTTVTGGLTVDRGATTVGLLNAEVANAAAMTIGAANIGSLSGPNDRISVDGNLHLNGNVVIDENTAFVGIIRTGGLNVAGPAVFGADITGANLRATASVLAAGNVQSGHNGALRAGTGGMFVGDRQVFDGNGNLLARPTLTCPQGQIMVGTDDRGVRAVWKPIVIRVRCFRASMRTGHRFVEKINEALPNCLPSNVQPAKLFSEWMPVVVLIVGIQEQGIYSVLRANS